MIYTQVNSRYDKYITLKHDQLENGSGYQYSIRYNKGGYTTPRGYFVAKEKVNVKDYGNGIIMLQTIPSEGKRLFIQSDKYNKNFLLELGNEYTPEKIDSMFN